MLSLDPNSLIAPLFTAVMTAFGVWTAMSRQVAVIQSEIAQLTKQVEKHNNTVERTYKLESDTSTMWRRIDELRQEVERTNDRLDAFRLGGSE